MYLVVPGQFFQTDVNVGGEGNALYTGDTYAPGDMRVPKVLGAKKIKKGKKIKIPIQRRTFTYF